MVSRVQNAIFTPDGKNAQSVDFTTAAAASSIAIPAYCHCVRLRATEDCFVSFDGTVEVTGTVAAPVTSGLSMDLQGGQTEYFAIQGGATISVRGETASGKLKITPMTE